MDRSYEASIGARFGKYNIVRKLGEGAFGSVYEALLPGPMGFTKRVALKKLRSQLVRDDPKFIKSMVNEARIGGLLHHANIVDVLEFDQVGRHYYIAMELVDGGTVSEIVRTCRKHEVSIPRFAILDIALQICRGLHYAHTLEDLDGNPLDLIHRDLKPSNVIVDRHGVAKICDFGIAKAASNLGHSTHSAVIKGTPRYMSPEQITGEPLLTPASDIFALGAVFYELITGTTLFRAYSFHALAYQILEVAVGEAPRKVDLLFPGFGPIFERMVARSPQDRYRDARTLADDLRGLTEANPPRADMTDVMACLLPNLEHPDHQVIDGTDDLDDDSDMITQVWSAADSMEEDTDDRGQIWFTDEDLAEAEAETAAQDVFEDMAFEPQKSDEANWQRFSKAFQPPEFDDDDSLTAGPVSSDEPLSDEITGPLQSPVSEDDGPREERVQTEEPSAAPPQVVQEAASAADVDPSDTVVAVVPPPDTQTVQVRTNRNLVFVLAALCGILTIVLIVVLAPRVFRSSADPLTPVADDGHDAATVLADGGEAEGAREANATGGESRVVGVDEVGEPPADSPAAEDGEEPVEVEPPKPVEEAPAAVEPMPHEPSQEPVTPSVQPPVPLTLELVEAPSNATVGFAKAFVIRVPTADPVEGALQIRSAGGEWKRFDLQPDGDQRWHATVTFAPEMVGRVEYYLWVQRVGSPDSRVSLGSVGTPLAIQVY